MYFLFKIFLKALLSYQKFQKEDLAFKLKNLQKLYEKRKQGLREEKRNFQDQKYMVDLLKKSTLVSKMDKIRKKLSDLQVSSIML